MKFIADLHIHSQYSRATSKNLNLIEIYKWAQLKGLNVVGTGDVTHPGWLDMISEQLEPAEQGLFKLNDEFARQAQKEVPLACRGEVRFLLSGEISNIYKKDDRVRKNHNVVFLPSIEVAKNFQTTLEKIGNIRSDGRPILGLDSRDLLEIVLELHPLSFLIPAHIWTPWFSVLGSKSGFDSIEECFEDLTLHIFALETGLSSDPPMNWRLSKLDRYTLVSNSDAHSPAKLAREANIFNCDLSYTAMLEAMKSGDADRFLGTIEFFPEEGKYHLDGHLKCNQRMVPKETIANHGICPVCGKKVTVGVLYRVEELADRPEGSKHDNSKFFQSLIPLPEVLAEIYNVGPNTKTVNQKFDYLLQKLGSELNILFEISLSEIEKTGGSLLAEGIRRMRCSEVKIAGGYDGDFGVIKLFTDQERVKFGTQTAIFQDQIVEPNEEMTSVEQLLLVKESTAEYAASKKMNKKKVEQVKFIDDFEDESGLNKRQKEILACDANSLMIVAGPGTGKTRTLTHRIVHLIQNSAVPPDQILAVTFTNRAAEEMRERLMAMLGEKLTAKITIKTFHALGVLILKNEAANLGFSQQFTIFSNEEKYQMLKQIMPTATVKELKSLAEKISTYKNDLEEIKAQESSIKKTVDEEFICIYNQYQNALRQMVAVDFDDLIVLPIKLFQQFPKIKQKYQKKFLYISVDEYQDINFAQYLLLQQLFWDKTNLCVIGDPDQAIYGFRGSDRKYFLQFEENFPNTKVFKLEKNYRSDSSILKASTQVIKKNKDHQSINIWSNLISNTRIDIFSTPTEKSEAETIVHQIEKMVGATSFFSVDSGRAGEEEAEIGSGFSDIAVLFRVQAQLAPLEEAFLRSGIPYQTFGEVPFFEIPEVKEIIRLLKIIHNPHSDVNLIKVFNDPPRGIGEQILSLLKKYQQSNEISLWRAMERCNQIARLSETQKQPVQQFINHVKSVQQESANLPVKQIIEKLLDKFGFNSHFKNDNKRQHYWHQLINAAEDFDGTLADFLARVVLKNETDHYDPRIEKVALMTLHAAKGLEFSVVFIVGCEENLIPFHRRDKPFDLEEERRLFYVGMTRAKRRLVLMHAKSRFLFGERTSNRPSRFLNDIEQALKENRRAQIKEKAKGKDEKTEESQLELF